ncbi:MAG: ATP-dependent DNA helicase [Thermodesulfobacteriota bacterium]
MKETIRISVRDLVERVLRSGDLDFGFSLGPNRLQGIRAHQQLQSTRPAEYAREVKVSRRIESKTLILEIGGRLDGVYRYADRAVIEEIKTGGRDPSLIPEADRKLHWGQVKVYGYLYALGEGLNEVEVRLTYYQLETGRTDHLDQAFTLAELAAFFKDLTDRYLEWAELLADWRRRRDVSINNLTFPYADYRPGQRQMIETVKQTALTGGSLLVQASTGTGKTISTLFPALQALAHGRAAKIFYLTARSTGRSAAEKTLATLRAGGLRLKSVTLLARDKICFRPEAACNALDCRYALGFFDRVDAALAELFGQDAWTGEVVAAAAARHAVCPHELSLELTLWADLVVADYNYAFDPRAYLRRFFDESGEYVLLVDEAHNLAERARDMFSARLEKKPFQEAADIFGRDKPDLAEALRRVADWLDRPGLEFETEATLSAVKERPADLLPLLEDFLSAAGAELMRRDECFHQQALPDLYFQVAAFLKIATQYDEDYASLFQQSGRGAQLTLLCLDPGRRLARTLAQVRASVFFSATLAPLDYFQHILGCGPEASRLILPSPFPRENLCLAVADHISTFYRRRRDTQNSVVRMIMTLLRSRRGNYLVFFPSYEYLNLVNSTLVEAAPDLNLAVQTPSLGEKDRDAFLARFESEDNLVGLAVLGGIFGEGIDLPGEKLAGAVIVGVGLPAPSPERELIREHFNRHNEMGYEYAYLYPGFSRVLQAAGRVIRSEEDRGVVLLIDQRYAAPVYQDLFPEGWSPVRVRDERGLAEVLDKFRTSRTGLRLRPRAGRKSPGYA